MKLAASGENKRDAPGEPWQFRRWVNPRAHRSRAELAGGLERRRFLEELQRGRLNSTERRMTQRALWSVELALARKLMREVHEFVSAESVRKINAEPQKLLTTRLREGLEGSEGLASRVGPNLEIWERCG